MAVVSGARARDFEMGGDSEYPNSIMAPEPGVATHHRATASSRIRHAKTRHPTPHERVNPLARQYPHRKFYAVRGSSGSVLPTPLPRMPLIAPEGSGRLTLPALPQAQGPTVLPGSTNPIPNLPHGPETFQDRASRCAFQQGLYNVPGNLTNRYMGACVQ